MPTIKPIPLNEKINQTRLRNGGSLTTQGVTIHGSIFSDVVIGTNYNDSLSGYYGHDELYGLGGNDGLNGDVGNDLLSGGYGYDILTGGSGGDSFVGYWQDDYTDVVTDFDESEGDNLVLVISDQDYANGTITIEDFDIVINGSDAIITFNGDNVLKLSGRSDLAGTDLSTIAEIVALGDSGNGFSSWGF